MNRLVKKAATEQIESIMSVKTEKNWTFSKILCLTVLFGTLIIIIYSCVAMWYFGDFSSLDTLITSIFAECAVISGFYSWKAKEENKIKLEIKEQILLATLNNKHYPINCSDNEDECGDDPPDGYSAP